MKDENDESDEYLRMLQCSTRFQGYLRRNFQLKRTYSWRLLFLIIYNFSVWLNAYNNFMNPRIHATELLNENYETVVKTPKLKLCYTEGSLT